MSYCPTSAWKKARKAGLDPSEQVEVGKEVSKILKGCNCKRDN